MDIVIIAHFITEFAKDGTSRFVYIAEHLSKQHNVEIVSSQFDHIKKQQRKVEKYDLDCNVTLLPETDYKKNVCLQRFASHARFGAEVAKYLKNRKKPDVIYCAVPSLDCAYAAAKYAKKNNIRFIIDVQDLWPEAFKMVLNIPFVSDLIFLPMKQQADYIYACADAIIGVSETYCTRAKTVNKKNAPCVPVYLGTKLDNFDKYVAENKIVRDDNKFILGYCGTLGHSYDIKCVLDAMSILKKKGYKDVAFWVMGDGPLQDEFKSYAEKLDLDVTFYGRVPYEKMCGLISACDVCVNVISKGAAQSIINKHADYAAAGLPILNNQSSDEYRGLIEMFECGINCECANPEELAESIIRVIEFPAERTKMALNARRMAELRFDRGIIYKKIYKLIM